MVRRIYFLLWRITAIICLLAWVIVFILEYHFIYIHGNLVEDDNLFSPLVTLCIQAGMICGSAFLVIFPLKFVIYGFLCAVAGLVQIIEGGGLPGIYMYFLGMLFYNKVGFFKKHKSIKIIVLSMLLFLGICTQYRYGFQKIIQTFQHLLASVLMFFLAYILYLPEIRARKKDFSRKIVRLPSHEFTPRDVHILKSIQKGEKYEAIAINEGIGVSTLKARVKVLFEFLNVSDKNSFLRIYANQPIVLEDNKKQLQ